MSGPVARIAVVGSDSIAWIAAMALRRAFRHRQLDVTVVASGSTASARRCRWTLPSQRALHGLLGIPEADFVGATGATYKLATEHHGWQGERSRFMHAHGEIGTDLSGTPFYKYLLNELIEGRALNVEDYSLASAAARLGKFARPMGDERALTASFTYGFHLDERAYTAYLRQHSAKLGVASIASEQVNVELTEGGEIAALTLDDGTRIVADLYLDCTGADAALIGRLTEDAREDWAHWLPCDRMLSGEGSPFAAAPPMTQTMATEAGWFWRAPTIAHTFAGYVYSSAFIDDDAARRALAANVESLGDTHIESLRSGRRQRQWLRNCIAIGAAAIELEPLVGADLHVAQLGVSALIELFPVLAASAVEAAEYNRVMGEHCDALRDFTLAHYHLGSAREGEFWRAVRATRLPDRLAQRLDLFRASGRVEVFDHESFEETDWVWLLTGSGEKPAALELLIQARISRVQPAQVAALRVEIARLVSSMPDHVDFIKRFGARSAPTRA